MEALLLLLVGMAGAGLVGSLIWHVEVLRGFNGLDAAGQGLLYGIFVIWLPTTLQLLPFRSFLSVFGGWDLALAGAPRWLRWLPAVLGGYAIVNFFLATGLLLGTVDEVDPSFSRVASGFGLLFYGMAFVVLYAAYRRRDLQLTWRCEKGHYLDDPAATCPHCGASVAAAPTPASPGA